MGVDSNPEIRTRSCSPPKFKTSKVMLSKFSQELYGLFSPLSGHATRISYVTTTCLCHSVPYVYMTFPARDTGEQGIFRLIEFPI